MCARACVRVCICVDACVWMRVCVCMCVYMCGDGGGHVCLVGSPGLIMRFSLNIVYKLTKKTRKIEELAQG